VNFYIELPVSTGIAPGELAKLWNQDSDAANLGEASVDDSAPKVIGEAVGQIVISVATGVLSSVIYDQLKLVVAKLREKSDVTEITSDEESSVVRITVQD